MTQGFAIAIDGPVASGKGTIASLLAKRLNGFHLYTGAVYRSIALAGIESGIDLENQEKVLSLLKDIDIDLLNGKVFLNGNDVTERIREADTAQGSSFVAAYPKVREEAVKIQQEIAKREVEKGNIIVSEGRDTATRVLPDAAMKIFLTADPKVRAKRRKEQEHLSEDIDEVLQQIRERDKRDTERETDPLVSNPKEYGYIIIDNSNQSEEETLQIMFEELRKKGLIT